jgi:hypothetical protein
MWVSAEVYVDKIGPESRVNFGDFKSFDRSKFHLALGNSVECCLDDLKTSKPFKGRCSIPFFCTGLPDSKGIELEPSKLLFQ